LAPAWFSPVCRLDEIVEVGCEDCLPPIPTQGSMRSGWLKIQLGANELFYGRPVDTRRIEDLAAHLYQIL